MYQITEGVAAQATLDGYRIKGDKALLNVLLPNGITLDATRPTVRLYSGSGTNTATEIYLAQPAGVWTNFVNDDCVRLVNPSGGQYRINLGNGCPLPGPSAAPSWLIEPERPTVDLTRRF